MKKKNNIALILIGDEILSGKTKDKNGNVLAKWAFDLGLYLREIRVISDNIDIIVKNLHQMKNQYDFIFTSGGIGPTHDDKTAEAVSFATGKELILNQEVVNFLKNHYQSTELNQGRLKMCHMPMGANLIKNDVSIVPGFYIDNIFVLAGVPSIFENMLANLTEYFKEYGTKFFKEAIEKNDILESEIADILQYYDDKYDDIAIGSYPKLGKVRKVEITITGHDKKLVEEVKNKINIKINERIVKTK